MVSKGTIASTVSEPDFCPQLCGAALLAVGIWVSVDGTSFLKIFGPMSSSAMQFVNVGYFLIAAGVVLFVLGFLGCYGAHSENKCALLMVCQTQHPRPQPRVPSPLTSSSGDPKKLLWILGASPWGHPASFMGVGGARKTGLPKTYFLVSHSVLYHPPPHLHC